MKRLTKGYLGIEVDLFPAMLNVPSPEPLPSRITSSPSLSFEPTPDHTTTAASSTSAPQHTEPSPTAEEHVPTPHDSPFHSVHSHRDDEGRMQLNELMNLITRLFDKISVLENDLQRTKKIYKDEDVAEDSSKQGRKISDIDEDTNIFLAQDDEVNWFQEETKDAQVQQEKSDDTEVFLEEGEPTEVVQDQGSGEKAQPEVTTASSALDTAGVSISTAGMQISTASTIHSTTGRITYSRRSVEKRKDKGIAIMEEPEPQKKSKKQLEQERLGFETAIRLQEQADEEVKAQITRDGEIARYYKLSDFKKMSYDDIRPIFKRVWNRVHSFVPKDSDIEKEVMTRKGFNLQGESAKQVEEEVQKEDVVAEQGVEKESTKVSGKRKKSLARRKEATKKQKTEEEADDQEQEDITQHMEIVPVEEIAINDIPLVSKPPIIIDVDIISEGEISSYHIIRANGSSKRYNTLTLLLQDINREDLEIL
ncbi:hypothetical protein Tco_1432707 [Tanacetum coccineum]